MSRTAAAWQPNNFRGEAPLSELLRDPIARALMIADKVDGSVVCELLRAAQRAS